MLMDGLDAAAFEVGMKAPVNLTVNTAASSANPRCETSELFARQALPSWSRPFIDKTHSHRFLGPEVAPSKSPRAVNLPEKTAPFGELRVRHLRAFRTCSAAITQDRDRFEDEWKSDFAGDAPRVVTGPRESARRNRNAHCGQHLFAAVLGQYAG